MGWESFDVVRFDLGLLQGQTKVAKLKSACNTLVIWSLSFGMVNQPLGNNGLGIF